MGTPTHGPASACSEMSIAALVLAVYVRTGLVRAMRGVRLSDTRPKETNVRRISDAPGSDLPPATLTLSTVTAERRLERRRETEKIMQQTCK